MQTLERLTAADLVAAVTAYRDALRAHQEPINRLNVYPVPDGDTGTNMALTLESVVRELAERGGERHAGRRRGHQLRVADGCAGQLRGDPVPDPQGPGRRRAAHTTASTPACSADGLARAADGAYQAVQNPVEGTILTVAQRRRRGAPRPRVVEGADLVAVLEAARRAAAAALARTPDLLPVLKTRWGGGRRRCRVRPAARRPPPCRGRPAASALR